MSARKLFLILLAGLGVNFKSQKLKVVVFIISLHVACFAYLSIKSISYKIKFGQFSIYTFIGIIQNDLLFVLHFIFVIRAVLKMNSLNSITKKFDSKLKSRSCQPELKFILNISFLIAVRLSKMGLSAKRYLFHHFENSFPEFAFAASDFMFSYLILLLVEDLKILKALLRTQNSEMSRKYFLENLSVKKEIQERYSTELLVTIVYNFVQLVISLYYVSMRIIFKHLETLEGDIFLNEAFTILLKSSFF